MLFACNTIPIYYINKLAFKFSLIRNRTVFGIVLGERYKLFESIYLFVNNLVIPVAAFLIITVCTLILAIQLRSNMEWRKSTVTSSKAEKLNNRNQKVAKMVVLISVLYIVCFLPTCTLMLAVAFDRTLFYNGKYINLTIVIGGISYVMESINSSMNIFIYHSMSSNFRHSVLKTLRVRCIFHVNAN